MSHRSLVEVHVQPRVRHANRALASQGRWSAELERIHRAAAPDTLGARMTSGFLGTDQAAEREVSLASLRAAILWECLPGCLAEIGWRLHGVLHFDGRFNGLVSPKMNAIELGEDEAVEVPENALVFAAGPGQERAVLRFEESGSDCEIGLTSLEGTRDLWGAWREHVRRNHRLRGRVILPTGRLVAATRRYAWEDLYLPESIKAEIRFHVEFALTHAATLSRFGVRKRRGVILHGVPGTGKTMIGKILAQTLRSTFVWATPRDLTDTDAVREVFEIARLLAPAVIFLEDLDILAEDRMSSPRGPVLGELMNQLDGYADDHGIVTIATTNRLDVVESACRNRPARFDRVIEIPPPDPACARALLASRLAAHGLSSDDLDWLAGRTTERTGAALEEIANTAVMLAVQEAGGEVGDTLRVARRHLAMAVEAVTAGARSTVGFDPAGAAPNGASAGVGAAARDGG